MKNSNKIIVRQGAARLAAVAVAGCLFAVSTAVQAADSKQGPIKTSVVKNAGGWHLERDGKPYVIKGAGGGGDLKMLAECGANSMRTWGADNLEERLDEAQKLGLTMTIGIWLGHERHGFNYNDENAVKRQEEAARAAILRYRNHPALLLWGIGNEMEGTGKGDNPAIWSAIERIAKIAKELDLNHPTMTVTAEIGGDRVGSIHRLCPDIDIMGINSYGGAPSIPERYRKEGGTKPYIVTEYGPPGVWEIKPNSFGAPMELTSTEKAKFYADACRKLMNDKELCLGSYAFTWGNKQEATATWYGLLLPDGSKVGGVDELTRLWSGNNPKNFCPRILDMKIPAGDIVKPGTVIDVALDAADPEGNPLKVQWILQRDVETYHTGGDAQTVPPAYPDAIVSGDAKGAKIRIPDNGGIHRVFVYLRDGQGGAAVANLPIKIDAPERPPEAAKGKMPFIVYAEGDGPSPYIPSGWMGNTGAVKMDANSKDQPHSGKTCLRVDYSAPDNWAGVVWLHPDQDWGEKAGGYNLVGAQKLSFWARGAQGGEKVKFEFGLIDRNKQFFDTAKGTKEETLSNEWKQYSIDLAKKDLSRIKTGFAWIVGGQGKGITFYLDDIQYTNVQ